MDNTRNTMEERNVMANSLEHILDGTLLYQDLINIKIPHYHQAGIPFPPFIPTSADVNSMFAYY